MTSMLPGLPGLGGASTVTVPPDSRYASSSLVTRTLADGRTVTWLQRRAIPDSSALVTLLWHVVEPADRLDTLAARYYGDSQLWWRIADANAATDPDELLVPGRRLRITHPAGIGGTPL